MTELITYLSSKCFFSLFLFWILLLLLHHRSYLSGGESNIDLPAQTGANLLSQQGLCTHYDDRYATAQEDKCAVDFHSDILGVWLTPVFFGLREFYFFSLSYMTEYFINKVLFNDVNEYFFSVSYVLLAFFVKYKR